MDNITRVSSRRNILTKFLACMSLSLPLMYGTARLMASHGFDLLAEISGGWALGIWLIIIASGAITAFFLRKSIWSMELPSAVSLLILYSLIAGITFSVLFLGDSAIAVAIVAVIFVLSALYNSEQAFTRKAPVTWALSVYLGVMMVLGFWVLIWGAWDTTKRRYSRKH